jgi:glycosyltransferase involved in cell wall biosynthesis
VKIGLLIYGTLDTLSGGYLYDRQLVGYLRSVGCSVEIVSLPWRTYTSHLTDNLHIQWAMKIAQASYDVLIQDELNHPSLFLLNRLIKQFCSSPIISIVHHLRSSEVHALQLMPFYRLVERLYLQSVDGFIYNSQTTRRSVESLLGYCTPGVVAYPAADHRQPPSHEIIVGSIQQRLTADGPLQLLVIGNIAQRKGLHTVLNALGRLPEHNWHLHIAGSLDVDPAYSTAQHQRAAALSIAQRLTWHGRISDEQIKHLLSTCDLLVMPSYEGFGIVYLEAMAFGLPAIAATAGAAAEIVTPGIDGYLVALDDDVGLAAHLRLLMHNRVHLATLAYFARNRYEGHPSWRESMQKVYQWLREAYSLS